jgi:hypothetical protein
MRYCAHLLPALCFLATFFVFRASAQTDSTQAQPVKPQVDSAAINAAMKLRTELQQKRSDRAMLQRILGALNSVDSVYLSHYPTWIVRDEDIKQRMYKTFRNRYKFPSRDSDLVVTSNPDRSELVRVTMGSSMMGREEVRLYVADSLQRTILAGNYLLTPLDPPEARGKRVDPVNPVAQSIFVEGSLFGAKVLSSGGWGGEVRVGIDDMGYPFWSAGAAEMLAIIDQLKLGVVLPLNVGSSDADIVGPLTVPARKLNGGTGFAIQYDQKMAGGNVSFHFLNEELNHKDSTDEFTNPDNVYYIHSMAQLLYSRQVTNLGSENFLTLSVGMGYHQIGRGMVQPSGSVATTDRFDYYSPIVRFEYTRIGMRTYGITAQAYSSNVFLSAWIEIIRNFVYIDVKYNLPIFRDPLPWEQPNFFMVSPRIRFAF